MGTLYLSRKGQISKRWGTEETQAIEVYGKFLYIEPTYVEIELEENLNKPVKPNLSSMRLLKHFKNDNLRLKQAKYPTRYILDAENFSHIECERHNNKMLIHYVV